MKAFVAIVIPTHRRPDLLKRALRSVRAQTYQQWECAVVSDDPDEMDVLKQVIAGFEDGRIRCYLGPGSGANRSRNYGVAQTEGDPIFYLDDDDEWLPEKIDAHLRLHQEGHEFVFSRVLRKHEFEHREVVVNRERPDLHHGSVERMQRFDWCPPSSSCVSVSRCLMALEPWDESLKSYQDWDIWFRMVGRTSIGYVDLPLTYFNQHSGVRTSSGFGKRKDALLDLARKHADRMGVDSIHRRIQFEFLKSVAEEGERLGRVRALIIALCQVRELPQAYQVRRLTIIKSVILPRPCSLLHMLSLRFSAWRSGAFLEIKVNKL